MSEPADAPPPPLPAALPTARPVPVLILGRLAVGGEAVAYDAPVAWRPEDGGDGRAER